MGVPKTSDHIQINLRMPNPSQEPPASSKAPNEDLKDIDVLCPLKSRYRAKIGIIGISKQGSLAYPNPDQNAKP